jgi:hypothetical protein
VRSTCDNEARANPGPPGPGARCFRTCTGSATARDSDASRDIDAPGGAFRSSLRRRRPDPCFFRGSIPGPHVPLSTLQRFPCEKLRMARGRCGSLGLQRMTLSFTTPRRFIPAHRINAKLFSYPPSKALFCHSTRASRRMPRLLRSSCTLRSNPATAGQATRLTPSYVDGRRDRDSTRGTRRMTVYGILSAHLN